VFQLASLTDVHWTWRMSGEVVLMTLLGGWAPSSARWSARAGVIVGMQNYLAIRRLGSWVTVIQGVIFVVCVLAVPPRHRRRITCGCRSIIRAARRPAMCARRRSRRRPWR
jgi:ABC-type branched-subunit amino acid transport system permease subunit